jgi:hypothetical protein
VTHNSHALHLKVSPSSHPPPFIPRPPDVECYRSMEPSLRGFDLVTNCELNSPPGKVCARLFT